MDASPRLEPGLHAARRVARAPAILLWLGLATLLAAPAQPAADAPLPQRLSETGLYAAGSTSRLQPGVQPFAPQHALWSDGADKQRWIALPPGSFIDASQPDAWQFPRGTRLWKEFSHGGRRVETRTLERLDDGSWRYATYLWNEDGSDAVLAPARGAPAWPVAQAPGGHYAVPSRSDCGVCHESTTTPVLGFSAVQLPRARGAQTSAAAPDAGVTLDDLVARGWLRHLPPALLNEPRSAARTPTEGAALGYLHANCGHCHNRSGAGAPVRLTLAQSAARPEISRTETLASMVAAAGRYRTPAWPEATHLIEPGAPQRSTLALRMRTRDERMQMPPLGTHIADDAGLGLVERWIRDDLNNR